MATSIKYLGNPARRLLEENAMHIIKADLVASDATAGVLSLLNATGRDLFIKTLTVRRTTAASGAGAADFGVAATEVLSDTLIDGVDVNATASSEDNVTNKGANGKAVGVLWANGAYLTGTKASGNMAGLAGQAIVEVLPV